MSSTRKPGKLAIVAIVVAVAVLATVAVTVFSLGRGSTEPLPSDPLSSRPFPTYNHSVQPRPTVVGAPPLSISIPAINVEASVEEFTVAMAQGSSNPLTGTPCWADDRIACINPPDHDKGYWLKAGEGKIPFGDEPGTDATGTVYIVGHSSSHTDAIFQNIHLLKPDDTITVTTANGTMTYYVQETVILDKSGWSSSPYANKQVPGRLVLGTCFHGDGADVASNGSSTQNSLVVAQARSTFTIGG